MRLPFGVFVPALILIGTLSAACDGGLAVEGNSAGPTRLRFASPAELGVQPESVRPTFGRDDSCQLSPPFSTTVSVIVTAAHDITIGGLGFEFTDTSGGRTAPTVTPGSSTAASIPTTLPVELPSSQAIPIPRPGALSGLAVDAGTRLILPFTLQFQCGVPGSGTLVIVVAMVERAGESEFARMTVRVG